MKAKITPFEDILKRKDAKAITETILAGFQQLDEDLKGKRKLKKLSKANKKN